MASGGQGIMLGGKNVPGEMEGPADFVEWLDDPWKSALKAIAELEQIDQDLQNLQHRPARKATVTPRPKVVAHPVEEKALCWTCQRSTWQCLCEWPDKPLPGIVTELMEGIPVVVDCHMYWPEH